MGTYTRPEVFTSRGLSIFFSVRIFCITLIHFFSSLVFSLTRIFIDLSLFGFYIKLLCCCLQWIISISFSVILMRLVLWNLDRDRWIIFIGLGLDLVQWFGEEFRENERNEKWLNAINVIGVWTHTIQRVMKMDPFILIET